jgi:hypothetical protein
MDITGLLIKKRSVGEVVGAMLLTTFFTGDGSNVCVGLGSIIREWSQRCLVQLKEDRGIDWGMGSGWGNGRKQSRRWGTGRSRG